MEGLFVLPESTEDTKTICQNIKIIITSELPTLFKPNY